jgi:hypothetical protein
MRAVAAAVGVVLVVGLLAAGCDSGCPEGTTSGVVGYHWVQIGKTGSMQPTYGCVTGRP